MEEGNSNKQEHTNTRQEGVMYTANQGTQHAKEEILDQEGYYDEHGFYMLPEGDFYDPNGYYFDKEGYDEFGGYYDDNLVYFPGKDHQD